MKDLILKLENEHFLKDDEFKALIENNNEKTDAFLAERAVHIREKIYGKDVYIRGLIEFTNYCKNDCYYCGIRKSNANANRYRMTEDQIIECCKTGYELGFRTFVLQGGEDGYYTDDKLVCLIKKIKSLYPDCALTLSIGEKSYESYKAYFDAGAVFDAFFKNFVVGPEFDRFLLPFHKIKICRYLLVHFYFLPYN